MRRRMMGWTAALLTLAMMLTPTLSLAQFGGAVYDHLNWLQNVATAISTADMARRQIQDLSLLADMSDYAQTMQTILAFAQASSDLSLRLIARYSRWQLLIPGAQTIPCTVDLLLRWTRVYDADTKQSVADAGVAQTLLGQAQGVMQSVSTVLDVARNIQGTVSGLQNLHSLLAKLVGLNGATLTMRAPMDEAQSRVHMQQLIEKEAHQIIVENQLSGMTGRSPRTCEPLSGI